MCVSKVMEMSLADKKEYQENTKPICKGSTKNQEFYNDKVQQANLSGGPIIY